MTCSSTSVYGVQQIDAGQTINPGVNVFFIRGEVEFWERDSASDNDFLGGFTVPPEIEENDRATIWRQTPTTRLLSKLWRMKRMSPGFRVLASKLAEHGLGDAYLTTTPYARCKLYEFQLMNAQSRKARTVML